MSFNADFSSKIVFEWRLLMKEAMGEITVSTRKLQSCLLIMGNWINGLILKELANISTFANLTLEFNQLIGTIPPEFGNLHVI
ncbi:uncharacterized protein [Henckelia pumila]|uniref:uncharacterized protein n=1 Tax=Henckelia pumila TaxID=405737 RepID=UPI003C6DD014